MTLQPYSTDVRTRVVQADEHHEGTMRPLAITFRVRLSFVRRRLKHYGEGTVVAAETVVYDRHDARRRQGVAEAVSSRGEMRKTAP
jgi:hypothetical protein